ncbi:MAG: hypothetical protein ACTSQY_00535 [Candidatus Odinarchaeia archaeon]
MICRLCNLNTKKMYFFRYISQKGFASYTSEPVCDSCFDFYRYFTSYIRGVPYLLSMRRYLHLDLILSNDIPRIRLNHRETKRCDFCLKDHKKIYTEYDIYGGRLTSFCSGCEYILSLLRKITKINPDLPKIIFPELRDIAAFVYYAVLGDEVYEEYVIDSDGCHHFF